MSLRKLSVQRFLVNILPLGDLQEGDRLIVGSTEYRNTEGVRKNVNIRLGGIRDRGRFYSADWKIHLLPKDGSFEDLISGLRIPASKLIFNIVVRRLLGRN